MQISELPHDLKELHRAVKADHMKIGADAVGVDVFLGEGMNGKLGWCCTYPKGAAGIELGDDQDGGV